MRNKIILFAIPVVILLALGGAGAWWVNAQNQSETDGDLAQVSLIEKTEPVPTENSIEAAAGEEAAKDLVPQTATVPAADAGATAPTVTDAAPVVTPAPTASPAMDIHMTVQGSDPKFPRAIGALDAPVTMYDYSSLTCPHCAHAHANILPQLIKEYVDTGKVRIVFADFPLNGEAMDASKVSRCMPADKYFGFVSLLFATQEQWITNHPTALIQNAVMAGLSEEKAKECLADKGLEDALIAGVKEAVEKFQVNATPTFILNDGKRTISGARGYEDFKAAIDEVLAETKKP